MRVVTQNLLHGTACAADSNRCDLPARVALFTRQLAANDCPEVVAVEEANRDTAAALHQALPAVCGGKYQVVFDDDPAQDRELVVTTEKVVASERTPLVGPLRTALWVRLGTPVGVLDLVATHLASDSDNRNCDGASCPAPCQTKDTLRTCQARQAADVLESKLAPTSVGVLVGDLNAAPNSATIAVFTDRGFVDTHLAAHNPECSAETPLACTGGRVDTDLSDMRSTAAKQRERIDYVFITTKRTCSVGSPTGVFAPRGGPTESDGLVFPSDHSGVEATIKCRTSEADLAAIGAPAPTTTTTTVPGTPTNVDDATRAAITTAYENVFSNSSLPAEQRLESLEQGDAFLESFVARINALGPTAKQVTVRVDGLKPVDANTVDLTYTLFLNGSAVLDAVPGQAVRKDGKWLVTAKAYCQVATLGTDVIPAPCK